MTLNFEFANFLKQTKMKALITLAILVFSSAIFAQHSTGLIVDLNSTSFTNNLEDISSMQGRLSPKTGFSAHAFFNDEFSEKLSFTLGIGYTYRRYKIETTDLRWPSQIDPISGFLAWKSPATSVILGDHLGVHDFHYISIPFTANYRVYSYGNNSLKIRGGLAGTWIVKTEASHATSNSSGGELVRSINLNSLTNGINLTASAGLDIGIYNSDALAISVVPTVGIELLSTSNVIDDYRLTSTSLGLQVMF